MLSAIPAGATDRLQMIDLYIVATRLRLRAVRAPDGIAYRLGHKVRPNPNDPGLVMHTSCYLTREEYEVLTTLPAQVLRKMRSRVQLSDRSICVDEFQDVLHGLVLGEVDLAEPSGPFDPPDYCIAEVSRDERFTGGALAATDRATIIEVLAEVSGLRLAP